MWSSTSKRFRRNTGVEFETTRQLFQEGVGVALERAPIIAAASFDAADEAVSSSAGVVLLMKSSIREILSDEYRRLAERKPIMIHFDFLRGLSDDHEAMVFLKHKVNPAAIVSTKGNIVRSARKAGIPSIERVFLIDFTSFYKTIDSINENDPDAVEVMPGIVPQVVPRFREYVSLPIILGGMISSTAEIDAAFEHGANAVSVGNRRLWSYRRSNR